MPRRIAYPLSEGHAAAEAKGKPLGRPKGALGKSKLDGKEQVIRALLGKDVSKASMNMLLVEINESVMKKAKTPHDVPTYGANDHIGHAANAKHEADWCVRNGDLDRAWGLYHEQQNRYLLHTTKRGSAFTPEATAALISSVNDGFANILRLAAKHRQALSHMIFCAAGAMNPTKGQLKKLPAYFKPSKFSKAQLS